VSINGLALQALQIITSFEKMISIRPTCLLSAALIVSWLVLNPSADSLKSISHVIIVMQENRSWMSYFGTMSGIRGLADPNVHITNGRPTFYQEVPSDIKNTTFLAPLYVNYLGGNWTGATQCMSAGDNV
jgi:phospholipase C